VLNEADLEQLGIEIDLNNSAMAQLGMDFNGTNCRSEEQTSYDLSSVQYTLCTYAIPGLNDTEVIVELKRFGSMDALNGSYQYESSHLFGAKGIISQNDFGDQSKFHVNSDDDYGAEFNTPGIYYYHLWFTKGLYMVHITSGGSEDAKGYIASMGRQFLAKIG